MTCTRAYAIDSTPEAATRTREPTRIRLGFQGPAVAAEDTRETDQRAYKDRRCRNCCLHSPQPDIGLRRIRTVREVAVDWRNRKLSSSTPKRLEAMAERRGEWSEIVAIFPFPKHWWSMWFAQRRMRTHRDCIGKART